MTRPIHEVLKEARLKKGIDLETVSRDTFIPIRFLKDMEEGNWRNFPSFVHKIGFLKKYLMYLKIPQEIIEDYPEFKPPENKIEDEKPVSSVKINIKLPAYILSGLIILVMIWLGVFHYQRSKQSNVKNSGYIGSGEVSKNRSVEILLKVTEDVWVRVFSDDKKVIEKTLKENDIVKISGKKINIRAGNAGGLLIEKEGKINGPFGKRGQVVEINIEGGSFIP